SFDSVLVVTIQADAFEFEIGELSKIIKQELVIVEPNLVIEVTPTDTPENVMELGVQEGIIKALYAAHNGVYTMSASIPDLVETSNNIAKVSN
ncbi:cytosol nonspecific dipeptidase, partial [Aquimarina celericrescens]|nr:cytosol nonspecific dipeptidase [Aquimarina celericrescens]